MNLIQLESGDHSADGHGQTDVISIMSNLTSSDLIKAFNDGLKVLRVKREEYGYGLNFCSGYGESRIPESLCESLRINGIDPADFSRERISEESDIKVGVDTYPLLWLEIAKLGNPKLKYEETSVEQIGIGGYGLFQM